MRAPAERSGDAAHESFTDDEIANAAFISSAAVVDDQNVAVLRRRDDLKKDVGAAGVPGRPRRTADLAAGDVATHPRRPHADRQRQLHARVDNERSGPIEARKEVGHASIMTERRQRINSRRAPGWNPAGQEGNKQQARANHHIGQRCRSARSQTAAPAALGWR